MKKKTFITLSFLSVATIGFAQTAVTAAKNPAQEQASSDTTAVNGERKIVSADKNANTTPAADNGNTQDQQAMPAEQITGREKRPK